MLQTRTSHAAIIIRDRVNIRSDFDHATISILDWFGDLTFHERPSPFVMQRKWKQAMPIMAAERADLPDLSALSEEERKQVILVLQKAKVRMYALFQQR